MSAEQFGKPPAVKLAQLIPLGDGWGSMFLAIYSDGAVRCLLARMEQGTVKMRYVPLEIER